MDLYFAYKIELINNSKYYNYTKLYLINLKKNKSISVNFPIYFNTDSTEGILNELKNEAKINIYNIKECTDLIKIFFNAKPRIYSCKNTY